MRRVRVKEFPIKLDLGCGNTAATRKDYTGMDRVDFGQDIVWDLTEGIPLPDDSVETVFSSHFFEHVFDKDLKTLIHEIIRVCQHGATVEMRCPHADTAEAHFLEHHTLWNEKKVQGICMGQQHEAPGHFDIVEMKREGMELQVKLRVIKNNIRR